MIQIRVPECVANLMASVNTLWMLLPLPDRVKNRLDDQLLLHARHLNVRGGVVCFPVWCHNEMTFPYLTTNSTSSCVRPCSVNGPTTAEYGLWNRIRLVLLHTIPQCFATDKRLQFCNSPFLDHKIEISLKIVDKRVKCVMPPARPKCRISPHKQVHTKQNLLTVPSSLFHEIAALIVNCPIR
jgi:hypothetical protein